VGLPQHADEHRPKDPVLLAVDQQLGEGPTLWVAPEPSDPVGAVEVGEAQHVKELGASRWREGLEASFERCLHLVEGHERRLVFRADAFLVDAL
jgi:hypothetical protein